MKDQTADLQKLSTKDVQRIVHELQVHQIELEMQNEELRRTQSELEESRNRYSNLYDFAPVGYFTFDKNGLIVDINLTGAHKLDVERSFLIKKPFSLYIDFSSRDVFYSHLRQVFKTNARQTCEIKLMDKNKNQFDVQLESLLVQDSEGNFSRCRTAISDITERKRAEEALSLLASIVESSEDAIIGKTLDGTILSWNLGAQKIYGYTADEVMGKSISILIPPDKTDEVPSLLQKVRQEQCIEHYETVHMRKDGKQIDIFLTISPIKDSTGMTIGASTIARDITERKKAEEIKRFLKEKELHLREIHHRVKNNMQIISSLLGLQSRYASEEKYRKMLTDSQNRIVSMSLIHEKLYRSNDMTKIDVKDYIRDLVNNLYRSYGTGESMVVFNADDEDIFLRIDQATPCGLIINELVNNSLKHAFPDRRDGKIEVAFKQVDENMFELVVSDNGIGIPENLDFRKNGSLGLHMVTILVEDQLEGEINLDRSRGTEFRIRFKA